MKSCASGLCLPAYCTTEVAWGGYRILRHPGCDLDFIEPEHESLGNLSGLRLTCSRRRVGFTPYSYARSLSSMTWTPRMTWIWLCRASSAGAGLVVGRGMGSSIGGLPLRRQGRGRMRTCRAVWRVSEGEVGCNRVLERFKDVGGPRCGRGGGGAGVGSARRRAIGPRH